MAADGGAGDDRARLDGLHICLLTSWASHLGGGVATAVWNQARMIRAAGGRVTVAALADKGQTGGDLAEAGIPLITAPVWGPRQIGYAPGLADQLEQAAPDLVHLNGIWMYPSHAGARWAQRTGRPYLISPHGMLDPWITARGRLKKTVARIGYEQASWARAAALHALTRDEAGDICREAGERPVIVIPNAGPPPMADASAMRGPLVLYLGRIHEKKNLGALLAAWAAADLPAGAELHIAGWGEATDVTAFKAQLATAPASVTFHGAVHGEAKSRLLRSARFTILPSHSEGLPMAILESWAAGAPTIMTEACHLPEGIEAGAALRCGTDAASIAHALQAALRMDDAAWQHMGQAALGLAAGRFSPDEVTRQWVSAYRQLVAGR